MMFLTIFRKSDRLVMMSFRLRTIITELDLIKDPDYDYVLTFEENIFRVESNGKMYLKENIQNKMRVKNE